MCYVALQYTHQKVPMWSNQLFYLINYLMGFFCVSNSKLLLMFLFLTLNLFSCKNKMFLFETILGICDILDIVFLFSCNYEIVCLVWNNESFLISPNSWDGKAGRIACIMRIWILGENISAPLLLTLEWQLLSWNVCCTHPTGTIREQCLNLAFYKKNH